VTADTQRRRALGQILLLTAAFLVLVAISAASVVLVTQARKDSALVVRTVEVENHINALLLDMRRAESAARGYLLTSGPEFLRDHESAAATILPDLEKLVQSIGDNPVQVENARKLRSAIEVRLDQFAREMNFVKQGDPAAPLPWFAKRPQAVLRRSSAMSRSPCRPRKTGCCWRALRPRTVPSNWPRCDGGRIRPRDRARRNLDLSGTSLGAGPRPGETRLRDNNLNLETTVDEPTADLREANDEIQRFAYIVSHDLRSPLVNIMGSPANWRNWRGDIFKRSQRSPAPSPRLRQP